MVAQFIHFFYILAKMTDASWETSICLFKQQTLENVVNQISITGQPLRVNLNKFLDKVTVKIWLGCLPAKWNLVSLLTYLSLFKKKHPCFSTTLMSSQHYVVVWSFLFLGPHFYCLIEETRRECYSVTRMKSCP